MQSFDEYGEKQRAQNNKETEEKKQSQTQTNSRHERVPHNKSTADNNDNE